MAFKVQENEQPILDEFREIMKGEVEDERMLLRFLRARDMNVKKAEQMLRKSVDWRNSNDIDAVKKWQAPAAVTKDFKMYYCGEDAEKRPVYLMPIGRWDGRKILQGHSKDEVCTYMYKTLEIIMDKCKENGVLQFHAILDFTELSFWKVAHWDSLETAIRVIRDFESNYPESLFSAHLVNAPSVFWQAFKAIKPILAQCTMDKIHIFDSDKKRWQEHLLQGIPKESLPKDYGGTGKATDFYPHHADAA